jgi:hypothetical protein
MSDMTKSMVRRLTQAIVVGSLGALALATPANAADEATCMALCQMQEAYCDAKGGTLVGSCYWDPGAHECRLNGCDLPQVGG